MIGDFYWTKLDNILAIFSHVECRTKNNQFFSFRSLSLLQAIIIDYNIHDTSPPRPSAKLLPLPPKLRFCQAATSAAKLADRRRQAATATLLLATSLPALPRG
jgi:hypothetical protein